MTRAKHLFRCAATALSLSLLLAACGSSAPVDPDSEVRVGLLLPFTGPDSAPSSNFERAALFAAARINRGGGIAGKPLRLISQDTHSDLGSAERSVDTLLRAGVRAVVGPESAEIGPELFQMLKQNGVALVSPFVGSGTELTACEIPWFRLAPSAQAMGNALADQIVEAEVKSVVVISDNDAYNSAFGTAASARFVSRGGRVPLELHVDSSLQSYGSVVRQALNAGAEAVVLAADARTGALIVNELDAASSTHVRWFLSPSLKTELFVANVSPAAIDGAQGVSPAIFKNTTEFDAAFSGAWQGDQPLEGAYFYFDAISLLAVALNREAANEVPPVLSEFITVVRDSAEPPGLPTDWDEVEGSLRDIAAGETIFYSGLTGPLLFKDQGPSRVLFCGDRLQQDTNPYWVVNGRISAQP